MAKTKLGLKRICPKCSAKYYDMGKNPPVFMVPSLIFSFLSCRSDSNAPDVMSQAPSTVLAAGAYIPEDSYMSLDMSMPKYDNSGSAELLAAPGSKVAGADGGAAPVTKPKKGEDPAKALARAEKEAAQRAAKAKKQQETLAKMEAKKAERAAIRAKRDAVME